MSRSSTVARHHTGLVLLLHEIKQEVDNLDSSQTSISEKGGLKCVRSNGRTRTEVDESIQMIVHLISPVNPLVPELFRWFLPTSLVPQVRESSSKNACESFQLLAVQVI